jgi:AmmeMemoRadiSam system protein A
MKPGGEKKQINRRAEIMSDSPAEYSLQEVAKKAVEEYVRSGKHLPVPIPVPQELNRRAGAFVCLKKGGELRGCIGTIEPTRDTLLHEVLQNAVSAAVEDPRFYPVRAEELEELEYSVDVLDEPELAISLEELDPKVYGVIVESGYKRGVLLPDLEGVDTVEEQLSIAMRKAGITSNEPVVVYKFKVTRHGE